VHRVSKAWGAVEDSEADAMDDVEESPVSLAAADGAELGTAKNDEAATEDEVGLIVELPKSPGSTDWEGAVSEAEVEVEVDVRKRQRVPSPFASTSTLFSSPRPAPSSVNASAGKFNARQESTADFLEQHLR